MGNLNDFPDLKKTFDALMAEKEAVRAESAPLWAEYNALQQQIGPIQARMRALTQQIQEIERPRLAELDRELAAIARQIGGRGTADHILLRR